MNTKEGVDTNCENCVRDSNVCRLVNVCEERNWKYFVLRPSLKKKQGEKIVTREPTESDYHQAIDDLVQVYHDLCPNVESFNAIYKELYDLSTEGKSPKAMLTHVITRLHAGVAHDIWASTLDAELARHVKDIKEN